MLEEALNDMKAFHLESTTTATILLSAVSFSSVSLHFSKASASAVQNSKLSKERADFVATRGGTILLPEVTIDAFTPLAPQTPHFIYH